jgi:hypothetical protein
VVPPHAREFALDTEAQRGGLEGDLRPTLIVVCVLYLVSASVELNDGDAFA